MEHRGFDEGDEDDGPGVSIVRERPPLREGRVFVDYDERATIAENLEAAYVRLNEAFRGIWVEKALESGHVREYWDDGDIDELESLTLEAGAAVENVAIVSSGSLIASAWPVLYLSPKGAVSRRPLLASSRMQRSFGLDGRADEFLYRLWSAADTRI